ncbi:hypothetical protein LTR16_012717, partial [Cryomyces antarcticus]
VSTARKWKSSRSLILESSPFASGRVPPYSSPRLSSLTVSLPDRSPPVGTHASMVFPTTLSLRSIRSPSSFLSLPLRRFCRLVSQTPTSST